MPICASKRDVLELAILWYWEGIAGCDRENLYEHEIVADSQTFYSRRCIRMFDE